MDRLTFANVPEGKLSLFFRPIFIRLFNCLIQLLWIHLLAVDGGFVEERRLFSVFTHITIPFSVFPQTINPVTCRPDSVASSPPGQFIFALVMGIQ